MKEGTNGNSLSAPEELNFGGKEPACGTEGDPGIRLTRSFYGKGNVGSEAQGAAGVMPVADLGGQRMVKSPWEREIRYPRQGCPTFPLPLP